MLLFVLSPTIGASPFDDELAVVGLAAREAPPELRANQRVVRLGFRRLFSAIDAVLTITHARKSRVARLAARGKWREAGGSACEIPRDSARHEGARFGGSPVCAKGDEPELGKADPTGCGRARDAARR